MRKACPSLGFSRLQMRKTNMGNASFCSAANMATRRAMYEQQAAGLKTGAWLVPEAVV
jgi:hypothetical protein